MFYSLAQQAAYQYRQLTYYWTAAETLSRIKTKHRHLRMGQIISIALKGQDLFSIPDGDLMVALVKLEKQLDEK